RKRKISGLRLHQIVEARECGARAGSAIGGKMRADEARIGVLQRRIGEAEPVRLIAAEIVEKPVGAARQRRQHLAGLRLLQVERQAALVAVEALEEMAVFGAE